MLELMRPIIGLAADPDAPDGATVEEPYSDSVRRAGGEPRRVASSELDSERGLAGLLLCGGPFDIPPEWYGQEVRGRIDPPRDRRSRLERALLERAEEVLRPVLGICNGAQLMSVVRGGTLVQDLPALRPGSLEHERSDARDRSVHPVELSSDSRLAALVGNTRIHVNSTHHQSIDEPGRGVRIVGMAPDGVVEAIEDPDHPFWVGVQWHPERLGEAHAIRLFEGLVEAARRHAAASRS